MKRRPLLTLVESQTREAPERRVREAREYCMTYAKRTARKPVRGIQIVGMVQRKLGSEWVKEGRKDEGTFLASFLPFFPIRPRIRATFRYPNAWRCLAVRIFSVCTLSHSPFSLGSDLSFDCSRVLD